MIGAIDMTGVVIRKGANIDNRIVGQVVVQGRGGEYAGAVCRVVDIRGACCSHRFKSGGATGTGFEREIVLRRVGPLVGRQVGMEQVVRTKREAVGLVAEHVQVSGDLRRVLSRPAVDDDGHVRRNVLEHLVIGEACVRRELECAGDVTRNAASARAFVVGLAEIVDDEVCVRALSKELESEECVAKG